MCAAAAAGGEGRALLLLQHIQSAQKPVSQGWTESMPSGARCAHQELPPLLSLCIPVYACRKAVVCSLQRINVAFISSQATLRQSAQAGSPCQRQLWYTHPRLPFSRLQHMHRLSRRWMADSAPSPLRQAACPRTGMRQHAQLCCRAALAADHPCPIETLSQTDLCGAAPSGTALSQPAPHIQKSASVCAWRACHLVRAAATHRCPSPYQLHSGPQGMQRCPLH